MVKARSFIVFIMILVFTFSINIDVYAGVKITNPNRVYTYNQMVSDIKKLKQNYPDLIQVKTIGKSEYGRDLYAVSVGKGQSVLFVNGSHHAREWLTTTLNMYMIEAYAEAYKKNQKIQGFDSKRILESTTIWFVPMVNPDGVTLQQQGLTAFPKNLHNSLIKMNGGSKNFKRWKSNAKGVDLNRQYNADWKAIKSPSSPNYRDYKGKAPESAAETKALLRFVSSINPEMAVSYHSSGKMLFWNYKQDKLTYNRDLIYANNIRKLTGYRLIYAGNNPSGGGFTDWFIQSKKRPAFTPEISRYVYETNPPLSEFGGAWRENQAVGLYTAQESFKLFDARTKQETDKLAIQLNKHQIKASGLRKYYYNNLKSEKDLKVDPAFKSLLDSVNKETSSLELQAAKLPTKHRARLDAYFKNISTYKNESMNFINGIIAGDQLIKATSEFETLFTQGKFDNMTFAKQTALIQTTAATEKSISKLYGTHVRTLAEKKYTTPAKKMAENTGIDLNRYTLTKTIEMQVNSGQNAAAFENLKKLEVLEEKSRQLKKDSLNYKVYPLVEERLAVMKKMIMDKLMVEEVPEIPIEK